MASKGLESRKSLGAFEEQKEGRRAGESWVEQGRHQAETKARYGAATPTSPGAHNSGPPVVLA